MKVTNYISAGNIRHIRMRVLIGCASAFLIGLVTLAHHVPLTGAPLYIGAPLVTAGLTSWLGLQLFRWKTDTNPYVWRTVGDQLPQSYPAKAWNAPTGVVVVGQTTGRGMTIDGARFAAWDHRDPHALLAGASGSGKTSTVRAIGLAFLQAGFDTAFLDCKGAGSFQGFAGREGVLGVADTPGEWCDLAGLVDREMADRYAAMLAHRRGRGDPPRLRPVALVADELVDGIDMCGENLSKPIERTVRMGRQGGGRVLVSLLRADVATGLSGLVKRSLTARIYLGHPDPTEIAMMFPGAAQHVKLLAEDMAFPPGRGIALLGGSLHRVQLPDMPDPFESSVAASLLPPMRSEPSPFERITARNESVSNRIAMLRGQGFDFKQVAQRLNADGYRQRDGKPWDQASVRMEA